MVFKELIELLKPIKSLNDVPKNLFDELINAALAVGMNNLMIEYEDNITEDKALLILQNIITHHCLSISDTMEED